MNAHTPAEVVAVGYLVGERFIAGGTNLLDQIKLQIEAPTYLIDVSWLPLDCIERQVELAELALADAYEAVGTKARMIGQFDYAVTAAQSWEREFHVIARLEHDARRQSALCRHELAR